MLFKYYNLPTSNGDMWYYPQRHDVFLYDSSGKNTIGINPDLYQYIPDASNPNYSFDYKMPSFSCVSARSRKTNLVPNAGCNPCPSGCFENPPYGGNPYSGCASGPRWVALTPAHLMCVDHYGGGSYVIGGHIKFYSSSGDYWQKVLVVDRYPIGIKSSGAAEGSPSGEITIMEVKAAPQNTDPSDDDGYFTVLGDPTHAPNVDIKYPYFLPKLGIGDDPLKAYMIEQVGFALDQDNRCHTHALSVQNQQASIYNVNYSVHSIRQNEDGSTSHDWLREKNIAILEDCGVGGSMVSGDSGSSYWTHIRSVSGDSPILLGLISGGNNFPNQLEDYIIPTITEQYDNINGTSYANDMLSRVIKRSDLGVDEYDIVPKSFEKESFEVIDLKPFWDDKVLEVEDLGFPVGEMINKNTGFLLDPLFNRVINFSFNDLYELSWSENEWNHDTFGELKGHRNFTIFNNEIYLCGGHSAYQTGQSEDYHYPDMNPGIVSRFKINSNNTVEYNGDLFDTNNNPIEFFGFAIASNSKELFISGGVESVFGNFDWGFGIFNPQYGYPVPRVIVFELKGQSSPYQWGQKQIIQPDGWEPSSEVYYTERFGSEIACSDEWLFIADDRYNEPEVYNNIYIFKKQENGEWKQSQIIEGRRSTAGTSTGPNYGSSFGTEMSINNNLFIVSAPDYSEESYMGYGSARYGAVLTYKLHAPTNQWLLEDTIKFDFKLDNYEENSSTGLPDFSRCTVAQDNVMAVASPNSIGGTSYTMPSVYTENSEASISLTSGIGSVSIYEYSEIDEEWKNKIVFSDLCNVKYKFGSFVSMHLSYDEYNRTSQNTILSLEDLRGQYDSSKELFSGGKIVIDKYSYSTFPIDKSLSMLRGLGQSFNTKLIPAYTKTIPFINTSSSPNGIVALPLDLHPAYSSVFEKYTKLNSPNGKAVHMLIQENVDEAEVVYTRDVLSKMLENEQGSLYGSNKTDVFNGMSGKSLIIGIFDNEDEETSDDAQFLTGDFNINIKTINQDDIFINKFLNTNKTIQLVVESIYTYGVYDNNPSMRSALNEARIQAEGVLTFVPITTNRPSINTHLTEGGDNLSISAQFIEVITDDIFDPTVADAEAKNMRYLKLGVEVYYGMWDHDPNGNGTSGDDEYLIISKEQLQNEDPGLYSIVNGFFSDDITIY